MGTSHPHTEPISDAAAFHRAVEPIVRALHARGVKSTRDRVARTLGVEPRQVQRLTATLLGMEWSTFARSIPTDGGTLLACR